MAEEKNNPPEEGTEDVLDQSAMDEFLAGGDFGEEEAGEESAQAAEAEESGELDQESIDALFGGGSEEEAEVEGAGEGTTAEATVDDLDQESIDALFSGGSDFGKEEAGEEGAQAAEAEESGELDQESIDALFGGGPEEEPEEGESALAEESGEGPTAESTDDGLDQESVDALFSGGEEEGEDDNDEKDEQAAAEVEDPGELNQESIDALFGGGSEEEHAPVGDEETESEESSAADLDQDGVDAMFAETGETEEESDPGDSQEGISEEGDFDQSAVDAFFQGDNEEQSQASSESEESVSPGEEPKEQVEEDAEFDQASIDALFSAPDAAEAADTGEKDEADSSLVEEGEGEDLDELFASLEEEDEEKAFLGDDFDFAEEIDSEAEESEIVELHEEEDEEVQEKKTEPLGEGGTRATDSAGGEGKEAFAFATVLPYLKNKKIAAGLGGSLAVVSAILIYLFMGGGEEIKERPVVAGSESANMTQQQNRKPDIGKAENFTPVARSADYTMNESGGQVEITLLAFDQNRDNLDFTITDEPDYGRLSGTPPHLIYLPSKDFAGKDRFSFRAEDGESYSNEATVMITGPDLAEFAAKHRFSAGVAEKVVKDEEKPSHKTRILVGAQPPMEAPDITLVADSTDEVRLDLSSGWERKNKSHFDGSVHYKMDTTGLRGKIKKIDQAVFQYKADPFFSGIEVIDYRFKKNGISSSKGRITIKVTPGDPPPEIALNSRGKRKYTVGEMVVIDASPSRDDSRHYLKFDWEQVAGVPVRIRKENQEGSKISFIMPSDFSSRRNPGPLLKVTATDASGQKDSELIKTRSVSMRDSALWRGAEVRGRENLL